MKLLIKLGGTLLDSEESRRRLAVEISEVAGNGTQAVVVHGGGKQMTRFLAERGVESRFVNGLRVTTPEVLDAVVKVLAGSVNQELVAAFASAGALAVGLTGVDAGLTEAVPMSEELGAVGRPVASNGAILDLLAAHGYLPVVACVAGDRQGHIYNVNADQMAAACAAGFGADQLIFLTDVTGVLDPSGTVLRELTAAACNRLIAEGTAKGGMQAKLNAACEALARGVSEVIIAPGAEPAIIKRLLDGQRIGTRLVREAS